MTWTGTTSTDFLDGTNWNAALPTNDLTTDIGAFSGSVTTNLPTLTGTRSISGLNFQSSGWTINGTGAMLSIGSNGITTSAASGSNTIKTDVNLGAAQSWNVGLGNTLVLSGSVTGTSALLINGAGTVKISGSTGINNAATISSGTLILAPESRIGITGTTGSLTLNGGVVTLSSTTGTLYLGNGATGAGSLTVNSGVLNVDFLNMNTGAVNNFVMTGGTVNVNTFTRSGNMTYLGGTMNVGTRLSFYGGAITLGGSNTQMVINLNGNGGNASKFSNGSSSAIILAANGTLNVDNSVYNNNNRLDETSDNGQDSLITMGGGALNFIGNPTINTTETISGIIVNNANSTVGITSLSKNYIVTSGSVKRTAGATVLFRGTNLGTTATYTANAVNLLVTNISSAGLVGTGTASGGSTGVTNLAILPYAVGDTTATGLGTDLVTYDTARGIRTLAANEYVSTVSGAIAGGTDNNVKLASVDALTTSGTINGLVVSSGTLNGTGFGLAVNSGAVLVTGSNNQINTGSLNFGAREGIVITNGNLLISGTVTGSAGLTKSGTGVLTLSGSNTYTGATTLNQGAISISSGANFGGSTAINFNGGSLQATGTAVIGSGIYLNNTSDVNAFNVATGARLELGGVVTGVGALATTGSGTLILTRTNSYTGATLINSGTLQIGNATGAGSISTASAIINNGTLAFNRNSGLVQGTDFANVISGTGAVAVIGGTATLTGSNTYTGTTSVNGGVLNVANIVASGNTSTLGNATSAVVIGGASTTGTLNYTGNSATFTRGLTVGVGGGELDTATAGQTLTVATGGIDNTSGGLLSIGGAGNTLVSSVIGGGAGGVTKSGAGTAIFTGANTYTGATTINSGTLQIGNGGTTGSIATSSAIIDNATLAFNRSNGAVQGVDFGAISGTGGVILTGGSLTYTGLNTNTGVTTLNAGTLLNITLANGTQWTSLGGISGAGALAINGLGTLTLSAASNYTGGTVISSGTTFANNTTALGSGTVSVVGSTGNTMLQLQQNLTASGITASGTTGALGILDTGTKMLTGNATINSGGVLQLSGTSGGNSVFGNVVVNSGGLIQSTNNYARSSQNQIVGDVTLNSGAVLTTGTGVGYGTGLLGRVSIYGNFVANAGSILSDNFIGYIALAGTSATINAGVTLLSATAGNLGNNTFSLVLNRGKDTTTLNSGVALDTIFIRDQDAGATGSAFTTVLNVSATGQNIGQIFFTNLDGFTTSSTTTLRMGNDLTVRTGRGIIAQSYGNTSISPVSLDLNGHTYDGTAAAGNGAWAPNTTGNAIVSGSVSTISPWSIVSTSGTGTFRAGSFNLTGVYTDVTIGSNVILAATALSGTSDLGLRATGMYTGTAGTLAAITSGTAKIDATSTFAFTGAGSHTLQATGTYADGSSRIIGGVQVGDGTSASTLNLGSAITTGTGSAVTVNKSSVLALGTNSLTTNGLLSISGGAVTASTGVIALGGDITASGTSNSSIGAAINTTGTANRNITVANAGTSLNISQAISGNANQLTKLGAGTLILGGVSTYGGATVVSEGELDVNGSLAAASTVTVSSGATLGGSGSVNGSVNVTDGTVRGSGLSMGDATYNGASTLSGITSANTITVASGTTTLTGHATSAGTLSVSLGGTLKNTGVATAGDVSVAAGGTLTNNGTVNGSVSVSGLINGTGTINGDLSLVGGTLAPGNSPGTTTVTGAFTMDALSTLSMQVTSGTSAGTYDQVVVSGFVTLAGTLDLSSLSTLTKLGDAITLLVNNSGQSSDTEGFFGTVLVGGSAVTLGAGNTFSITIGETTTQYALAFASSSVSTDGVANDLELMVVPEPSTWAMLVGGIGALLIFRKVRKFQVLG